MPHGTTFDPGRRKKLPPLIIVFAKAPRPGFVKTRLGLEPGAAALLYKEFVKKTLNTVCDLRDEAELELSLDVPCATWLELPIHRTIQHEGDLGVRLYTALEHGLVAGHPNVLILGSDSPTLPAEHIRVLLNCDVDVALARRWTEGITASPVARSGQGCWMAFGGPPVMHYKIPSGLCRVSACFMLSAENGSMLTRRKTCRR